ncbi:MAG: ADP-ribosylglycohydrolase family protein [Bryobacteraceae bacterium]|nr:ADP-ribosylglycohydrolase family protein [Bryobacteraceae bacterium]
MRYCVALSLLLCLAMASCSRQEPAAPETREISMAALQDKIKGGWAGQMIGVSYGAPTEFRYRGEIIPEDKLPQWKPEMIHEALDQDDIYVDMTFAEVLERKGLDATTEDFGEMFKNSQYRLWHANMAARRNLQHGVPAADSGHPRHNIHANDIDFQIEADFIGLMTPGLPQASNDYCWRAGRVMNYGDGIYGGMFVCGMYSAAFFESNPRKLVEAGLACLPKESPYAQIIADSLAWSNQHPGDWTKVWQLIQDKWDKRDPCPAGALLPFNIDAKLNGVYIALGLLYGEGDFEKTLKISTQAGQDSDCNPASAGGILGVVYGYDRIPDVWKSGIPAIEDKKFAYTNHTFRSIVESSTQRAVELVQRHGGQFQGDTLVVRVQDPTPAALETWDDYGSPVERIPPTDSRWTWTGRWAPQPKSPELRASSTKGAEATVSFEGTGFILAGTYLPTGGKLDVQVDSQPAETVDVYIPEGDGQRGNESVFHRFGLAAGKHTVKVVVRGEPYEGSKGRDVVLKDLIVFR